MVRANRKRRWHPLITASELQWLWDNHYVIRCSYIGIVEGYDYTLYYTGGEKILAIRKSDRACYNYARKLEKEKRDSAHKHGEKLGKVRP